MATTQTISYVDAVNTENKIPNADTETLRNIKRDHPNYLFEVSESSKFSHFLDIIRDYKKFTIG